MSFEFEFLEPARDVRVINPKGSIVIITLWTPVKLVEDRLPVNEHIAVVGGLYGGGFNILLRNLMYNPQIDTILIFGKELGHGSEYLQAYFNKNDVEYSNQTQEYSDEHGSIFTHRKVYVKGGYSSYIIDECIAPICFSRFPRCVTLSTDGIEDMNPLLDFLNIYTPSTHQCDRRIVSPILTPIISTSPSNPFNHSVCDETIIDTWKAVLFKINRFGNLVEYRNNKTRKELINFKAVINNPCMEFKNSELFKYNLSNEEIYDYTKTLLSSTIPEGQNYSYGNRLTAYFNGENNLLKVIQDLSINGDRRRCYITLWDNTIDITRPSGRPCMTSLWFRKIDDKIHMTVTFRTHNGAFAWIKNAFGLANILQFVCEATERFKPGTLTIISHSISLDPNNINQVSEFIKDYQIKHQTIKMDHYGYLRITTDPNEKAIIVQHFDHDNNLLAVYKEDTPQKLQHQLYINQVISDIGHAMYIGNQLEKAYICLNNGIEYVQDKKIIKL